MFKVPDSGLPEIQLHQFVRGLSKTLPRLIRTLRHKDIQFHPKWGRIIPYDVLGYGQGISPGHCIRPDIIFSNEDGPKVCELDFVASGRAHLLQSLEAFPEPRRTVLQGFESWYKTMGAESVVYATATNTTCFLETQMFADALREEAGTNISAQNVDEIGDTNGLFIDRLSYRAEMDTNEKDVQNMVGAQVSTAEPFLDSKAVFALVHDKAMTEILVRHVGKNQLQFLRTALPYTVLLDDLGDQSIDLLIADSRHWVVKNTDVETTTCWGSRGTILGSNYRKRIFRNVLIDRNTPGKKSIGRFPIVQRLYESADFTPLWNKAVLEHAGKKQAEYFGRHADDVVDQKATEKVHGRIGVFLTIAGEKCLTETAAYAEIMLRQNALVHGAGDAMAVALRVA